MRDSDEGTELPDPRLAALLTTAWSALGRGGAIPQVPVVTGWRPDLLASPLPCGQAMTAAVACALVGIASCDAARTGGRHPRVALDAQHVAVAAVSERHAHIVGSPPPDLFAPLSRFWRTADGWIRTHMNYPWHKERALAVLGCSDRPDDVAAAIRAWSGEQLEEALAAAGGVAAAVRTPDEWRAHEQGRAVGQLPLVMTRSGGRPRTLRQGRFLEGIRVLDLTRVIAGPVATRTLAAWGADVLRIDPPHLPEIRDQEIDSLSGKRCGAMDFRPDTGRRQLQVLLDQADVVIHAYRPGALDRFGLGEDTLRHEHPHLTAVSLSAWGATGPWAQRRGFDSVVQAPTGISHVTGTQDQPGRLPAQILDHATGYLAAAAAALSIGSVAQQRQPAHARLSLAQTAGWLGGAATGEPRPEHHADPAPYLIDLTRADDVVRVVAPVGEIHASRGAWSTSGLPAAQPPSFECT